MFECLSMLCVMIAAKQQSKFSIDAQNQQKSTKNQHTINYQQSIPNINDQNRQQEAEGQQPIVEKQHETRSEKRQTTRAVSNMPKSNIMDESPLLVVDGGGNNKTKPANSLNGTSLITTSAKIQQKQQKFLAAAAKSATSPPSAMIKTPSTTSIIGANINNIERLPFRSSDRAQTVVDTAVTGQKPITMSDDIIVNCCQPVVVFDANMKPPPCFSSTQAVYASQLPHAGHSLATLPTTTTSSSIAAVATISETVSRDHQLESQSSTRSVVRISAETDSQVESSPALFVKCCDANLESAQESARYDQTNQVVRDLSTDAASTADNRRDLRKVIGEEDKRAEEVEKIDDKENSSFVVSFASDQSVRNVPTSSTSPTSLQNYHHHQDNNFLSSKQHFISNKHQNITPDNHHHHHHQNYHNQHNHYQNNHNNTTTTTTTPLSHPNHQYNHNQSINYNNCTNNLIKMPTQKFKHNQETFIKPKDQKISLVNKDNITSSTPHSIGTKNTITNSTHQDNIIANTCAGQQPSTPRLFNNFNNTSNHHHHHQQQQQHPQQTMAHYKFHNDCQSSVLTYEQVKRLDIVMDQTVPIHGRGNFPTLYVKLKELIRLVKYKLQTEHSIQIRDVRLNGGAASYVLAPENSHYNDLDLIFGTDLSNEDQFDVIRDVVLECLEEFFPKEHQDNHYNDLIADHVNINGMGTSTVVDDSLTAASDKLIEEGPLKGQVSETISCDSKDLKATNGDDERSGVTVVANGLASVVEESQDVGLKIEGSVGNEGFSSSDNGCNVYQQTRQLGDHSICAMQQNFQYHQMPLSSGAIKEAYVHKMVKVNDDDRWSLISLGVQQSEVNCCGLNGCSLVNSHRNSQQQVNCTSCARQPHQFPSVVNQSANAKFVSKENSMRNHQFPNSIELKFVDRMRRKFEFSVDSFQIILDSLIQFYDCAPQSTISSQRSLINSQLASTMINTRTSVDKKRCAGCCGPLAAVPNCKLGDNDSGNLSNADAQNERYSHTQNNQPMSAFTGTKSCAPLLNGAPSYYQLPIESANLPSISSAASSSGCSSSSSVVSSSSSSLSCDEDHEDLYCDTDSPSSSSSTSTSSLISSTTLSLLSSDGLSNSDRSNLQKFNRSETLQQTKGGRCGNKDGHHNAVRRESIGKLNAANVLASNKNISGYCMGCCCQGKLVSNTHECETNIRTSCAVISENFYPTVIGRSEYGNFKEALYHLEKKLIATRSPEEIRGGGMLKYCNLLVKSYKPVNVYQIRTLERYMCSRFFIDFSDLNQQQAKLESYLANHFSDDPMLKFDYLTILHNVVQRSTVCLMNHELRLTLDMIRNLAYKLNEQRQQQQQHHHQQLHHQPLTNQNSSMAVQPHQQVQQQNLTQAQHQQYYKQKPILIQSGVYRVKLVNYTLARPKT